MRILVVVCAIAIVGCSGGGAPGKPPVPAGPLPSMYDLTRDATEALRAAVAADPYFALPYFYLSYRGFLAHASLSDTLRKTAARAISRLGGT